MSELQDWREQARTLTSRVREAIADAAIEGNLQLVQSLSEALSPLESLTDALIEARRRWQRQLDVLDRSIAEAGDRGPVTRLEIVIDWRAAGKSLETMTIRELTAAKTLARFIDALVRALGVTILPRLQELRVGSAGLVSRQPEVDFKNPITGAVYGYQPIGISGWFVHTHTSNRAKLEQITRICSLLALPLSSVRAKTIPNPTH